MKPNDTKALADNIISTLIEGIDRQIALGSDLDDIYLEIEPETLSASLADADKADSNDKADYYCVMDLLTFDTDGAMRPDADAIDEVAASYFQ